MSDNPYKPPEADSEHQTVLHSWIVGPMALMVLALLLLFLNYRE